MGSAVAAAAENGRIQPKGWLSPWVGAQGNVGAPPWFLPGPRLLLEE